MNTETRQCQNCKQPFTIEPDDFAFYEHMAVPPPTFCPQCRFQRRMSWRNGWHLFKKKEILKGEEIFSFFPQKNQIPIFERDYWFSDAWDPLEYGQDYDFSRPFFEQFKEFLKKVPEPAHSSLNLVNCRYCMNIADAKNCYLVRAATFTEDSAYVIWDHGSKQCMDSHMTDHCDLCYGSVNIEHCYKAFFSVDCDTCQDITLCKDCVGCNNCFGCFGLRSKSYCIFNKQYTREEYKKKLEEFALGSHENFSKLQTQARAHWQTFPHKFMHSHKNVNVSGDYIYESKNAIQCYRVRGVENAKFVQNTLETSTKDSYDYSNFGENAELCYETLISGRGASNIKFCVQTYLNVKNVEYSIFCRNVSDCFGCISLRDKQYCIFNKQYNREAYFAQVLKIKEHMANMPYTDVAGHVYRYGEFFPPDLSPFPYRVTEAYEFFPFDKEKATAQGFLWYDTAKQPHSTTLPASQLADHIKDASEAIIQEVIGCEHGEKCDDECTGAFRVIPEEFAFLRRMNIPLPRLCPNCRHYERLKLRNPPHFYHRQCVKCGAEFETSYAPDRLEKIYCEPCYQAEVV